MWQYQLSQQLMFIRNYYCMPHTALKCMNAGQMDFEFELNGIVEHVVDVIKSVFA